VITFPSWGCENNTRVAIVSSWPARLVAVMAVFGPLLGTARLAGFIRRAYLMVPSRLRDVPTGLDMTWLAADLPTRSTSCR
jgi:hypothetical protein